MKSRNSSFFLIATAIFLSSPVVFSADKAVAKTKKQSATPAKTQATPTSSTPSSSERPFMGQPDNKLFDVTAFIGPYWNYGFGFDIGVQGAYRIVTGGFISGLNNSVSIETGLHYVYSTITYGSILGVSYSVTYSGIEIPLLLRWDFQMNSDWTFYAAAGLGLRFGTTTARYGNGKKVEQTVYPSNAPSVLTPEARVGAIYALSSQLSLRGEVGISSGHVGAMYRF